MGQGDRAVDKPFGPGGQQQQAGHDPAGGQQARRGRLRPWFRWLEPAMAHHPPVGEKGMTGDEHEKGRAAEAGEPSVPGKGDEDKAGAQHPGEIAAHGVEPYRQVCKTGGDAENKANVGDIAAHHVAHGHVWRVAQHSGEADEQFRGGSAKGHDGKADERRRHTETAGKTHRAGDEQLAAGHQTGEAGGHQQEGGQERGGAIHEPRSRATGRGWREGACGHAGHRRGRRDLSAGAVCGQWSAPLA